MAQKKFNLDLSRNQNQKSHGTSEDILDCSLNENSSIEQNNPPTTAMDSIASVQEKEEKSRGTSESFVSSTFIEMIHRDKIIRSNQNFFDKEGIEELASLIKAFGLEQNLLVEDNGDGTYKLLGGERRHRATELIHSETGEYEYLPCKVEQNTIVDETDELIRIICSNTYRQFTDAQKFEIFTKLKEATEKKLSSDEIGNKKVYYAKLLKMSETQIQRCLNITNNLVPKLKEQILSGDISIRQADELSHLPEEEQVEAAELDVADKQKKSHGTSKEICYQINSDRLGLLPEIFEDTKVLFSTSRKFKDDDSAIKADKLLTRINKELQQLNELLEASCTDV